MCKQISSHLKIKPPTNYPLTNHIMYIYLNVCKQMTDVKLLLLYSNTWNHLTVCKQIINRIIRIWLKYLKTFTCVQS